MIALARELWFSLIACAALATPSIAFACPVCFSSKNEANRLAFIVTTAFLTALPLVLIGGLIYWVFRRARALERLESEE